jgi:DNA-directed RNA polymerase subunit alpha
MIPLPSQPKIIEESGTRAVFELEGLYPGYGHTIGNSLRRVLLSSLEGAAVISMKIEGVGHEFSVIEDVMEDVVEIVLNLKQLRFRIHGEGQFTATLSVKGEREVTGKDFEMPSQVELVSRDVHIATLTSKKAHINMEIVIEAGRGYVPVEARTKDKVEVGTIALDAAFSPVRHVNYEVADMRVGDRTDYNRVRLSVETDGSLEPRVAFEQAVAILVEQFRALTADFAQEQEVEERKDGVAVGDTSKDSSDLEQETVLKQKLDELKLSARTLNALREAGIKTVGGLSRKKESALRGIEGMGDKGIQEIKKVLGNFGITLKQ